MPRATSTARLLQRPIIRMVTVSRPRCVQHFSGKGYATNRRAEGEACNLDEQWHPGASGGWHKNRAEQQQ